MFNNFGSSLSACPCDKRIGLLNELYAKTLLLAKDQPMTSPVLQKMIMELRSI